MKTTTLTALTCAIALVSVPCLAQPPKPKPKPAPVKQPPKPPVNETKAQGQMQSINGQFGTIYTLSDKFNFEILSARYTMEEILDYNGTYPEAEGKLLVITFAVKNANPKEDSFAAGDLFTAVDDKGQLYNSTTPSLKSMHGAEGGFYSLKPGQGLGQPALNDPLEASISIPAGAKIVKIFVNRGRAAKPDEKVLRYYVAGVTKAEAGDNGDPKNIIAPLPEDVRDPSDKTGAMALKEGKGVIGKVEPSRFMRFKVNTITASATEKVDGNAPADGKKFIVVSITTTTLFEKDWSNFSWPGGGGAFAEIVDADGEKYQPSGGVRKPSRDEASDRAVKAGEEYTYRIFFEVPKDVSLKTLTLAAERGRKWAYDIASVK